MFSDFTPDETKVTLRFSMVNFFLLKFLFSLKIFININYIKYDPHYFSPAVVSINIDINLPPVGG